MKKNHQEYPLGKWRLLLTDPLPGPINMALDAAILAAVETGQAPPTLRLYSWDPPCLSLGYSQSYADIDQDQLLSRGWDVVRRPTGGRAILHTDELTYAVIGPRTDPRLEGGLMDSYRRLSGALTEALLLLGLPVEIHQGKNPLAHHQPVCFENPSDFEITVGGKKIIGSAQARRKNALLQHGSLPLGGDLTRITWALTYPTPQDQELAARTLLEKAATVGDVLGKTITWTQAAEAFCRGFSEVLNLKLVEGVTSPAEQTLAEELLQIQFANQIWTRQIDS
jgi:lipoate-protein ligase A